MADIDKISSLITNVAIIEERLKQICKQIDSSEVISSRLKEDINKVIQTINEITKKIESHTCSQKEDKLFILENIDTIKSRVAELVEKSFTAAQLHNDVVSVKQAIRDFIQEFNTFKTEYAVFKEHTDSDIKNKETHRDDRCVEHRKQTSTDIGIITKWRTDSVEPILEDYKKFRQSVKTIHIVLTVLLLVLGIIVAITNISININKIKENAHHIEKSTVK